MTLVKYKCPKCRFKGQGDLPSSLKEITCPSCKDTIKLQDIKIPPKKVSKKTSIRGGEDK